MAEFFRRNGDTPKLLALESSGRDLVSVDRHFAVPNAVSYCRTIMKFVAGGL